MKSLSLMCITVFSKIGGTFLLFVFLARFFSVTDFGNFVVAYSAATILAILVDFGFSQSLLKDIGSAPAAAGKFVREGLSIKLVLSGVSLALAVVIAFWRFDDFSVRGVFLLLVAFSIFNSFSEYLGTSLRAIGRYTEEAIIQFVCTALMLGLVVGVGLLGRPLIVTVLALLATKVLQLSLVGWMASRTIDMRTAAGAAGGMGATMRRGLSYAADQGVSNALSNVDVLIVSSVMGSGAAAIYQAGQKLVQGYGASALILSNVYLPRLARVAARDTQQFRRLALQVGLAMVLVGLAGGGLLLLFPGPLVALVYGDKFRTLVPVLPFFGGLIFLRFCSGALGLCLTGLGEQSVRTLANAACLLIVLAISAKMMNFYGMQGMVYAQLIAVSVLLLLYIVSISRIRMGAS